MADLSSPFHPLELALVPENNFAIRLLAKSVGVVTVRVTVVTNRGKQFSDSVVVKVVEVFSLLNPACSCEGILMAPHSRGKLRTTKDGRVQYRVLEGQGEAQLQVDRYGDMSSGGQLGWGVLVVESQESDSARILSRSVEVQCALPPRPAIASNPQALFLVNCLGLYGTLATRFYRAAVRTLAKQSC